MLLGTGTKVPGLMGASAAHKAQHSQETSGIRAGPSRDEGGGGVPKLGRSPGAVSAAGWGGVQGPYPGGGCGGGGVWGSREKLAFER